MGKIYSVSPLYEEGVDEEVPNNRSEDMLTR